MHMLKRGSLHCNFQFIDDNSRLEDNSQKSLGLALGNVPWLEASRFL